MKKLLYMASVVLLIGIMLISSYFIFKELKGNNEQEKVFEELTEIVEKGNDKEEKQERDLQQLYKINNDFVGWLDIENTTISYPIMQTKNNPNYYLKRDFYKKYSSYGTPYISEQCNIYESDNLIIYGHHMKNKAMFGTLENYKSKEYYKNHKIITFETLEKSRKYEIFAVFKTVAYSNNGFKYYNFTNLQNNEEYKSFINKCKELSFYETNKEPKYGDKLITLSTCEYSNKNGRLVVIAYEVNS